MSRLLTHHIGPLARYLIDSPTNGGTLADIEAIILHAQNRRGETKIVSRVFGSKNVKVVFTANALGTINLKTTMTCRLGRWQMADNSITIKTPMPATVMERLKASSGMAASIISDHPFVRNRVINHVTTGREKPSERNPKGVTVTAHLKIMAHEKHGVPFDEMEKEAA